MEPPQSSERKIYSASALLRLRKTWKRKGLRVGLTNGCFDILHKGHVSYLQNARKHCDILIVALNSDRSVRKLNKAPNRPVNPEKDRAFVLAGLSCVDAAIIFNDEDARPTICKLLPDIYFKGGDYTRKTLNQDEVKLMDELGIQIIILPGVPGRSTTAIIARMQQ